jgi:hypothetical protein
LRRRQLSRYPRIYQYFMKPEDSSPCSQGPSTGPYPEPDQSSSYHSILSLLGFILILSHHLCLSLLRDSILLAFPSKSLHAFLFSPICLIRPAHLIILDLITLIILDEMYKLFRSLLYSFLQPPVTSTIFGPNNYVNQLSFLLLGVKSAHGSRNAYVS